VSTVSAIILVAIFVMFQLRHRERTALRQQEAQPPLAVSASLEREVTELRERVAVLERIVTDDRRGRSLAEEIEALRER
jgi:hypothetical protein